MTIVAPNLGDQAGEGFSRSVTVITSSALYGSASWVLTDQREQLLRRTQIKMMRTVLARRRIVTIGDCGEMGMETWVDWVQRFTAEAREKMRTHGIPDWPGLQRDRVLQWGNRLHRTQDIRWTRQAFYWQPGGQKGRGHPCVRWADQLLKAIWAR